MNVGSDSWWKRVPLRTRQAILRGTVGDVSAIEVDSKVAALAASADAAYQPKSTYQALDATLTAIAALTTAANQIVYATGADAFAMTSLDPWARANLLTAASAAASRTALALGALATLATVGSSEITNGSVTMAKIENMTQGTIVGRASGAGTGAPSKLTAAQVAAIVEPELAYPDQATQIGVDSSAWTGSRASNVQEALDEIFTLLLVP